MMNDIKKAIRLVPMGIGFKTQMVTMGLFLALGIVIEIAQRGTSYLGGFYLSICALYIGQLIISLDVSTLVQSSPYKKLFQVHIPLAIETIMLLLMFSIVVAIHAVLAKVGIDGYSLEENYAMQARCIFTNGIIISITAVFFGICYKYFIPAMVAFFLLMIPILGFSQNTYLGIAQFLGESLSRAIIASYILIIVGFGICYLLSNLAYKKDISKIAFAGALRQAAK